jgi:hypothetical protein
MAMSEAILFHALAVSAAKTLKGYGVSYRP